MIDRSLRNIILTGLCLLTAVTKVTAESRPELKFLKPLDLPSIGLKMSLMPESKEVPTQPPQVFHYTMSQGEKKWSVDMFSPSELWRNSQLAGKWVDQRNNTITLATMTTVFPADKFAQPHAPKDVYEKAIGEANSTPVEWTDDNIARWVETFTGAQNLSIRTIQRTPPHVKTIKAFSLSEISLGYAFCLNRPAAVSVPSAPSWYFVAFNLNPNVDREKALKSINDQFFPSLNAVKVTKKQIAASTSFQSSTFAGKKQKSPAFIASRQQVADSIKNMKDWWFAETENYIFLSNMKSKHRVTIKDLQEDIEYLRDAFEQFMPPRKDITAVSVVRAFASSDEYVAYVGKDLSWSWGLWTPSYKELVIRPVEGAAAKIQRAEFSRIVFHEAFHQYVFYAFDQKSPAVWFNEGHADFYSSSTINERKFSVTESATHAKIIDGMVSAKSIDIDKLLHLSHEEFYAGTNEARQKNYALAWALVYYLRKGSTLDTPPKYAKILDKYAEALWETGDGNKATEAAFSGIDINTLQRDFIMFWTSQRKRGAALRNNIFKTYNPSAKR